MTRELHYGVGKLTETEMPGQNNEKSRLSVESYQGSLNVYQKHRVIYGSYIRKVGLYIKIDSGEKTCPAPHNQGRFLATYPTIDSL